MNKEELIKYAEPAGYRVLIDVGSLELVSAEPLGMGKGLINLTTGEHIQESGFSIMVPTDKMSKLREQLEGNSVWVTVVKLGQMSYKSDNMGHENWCEVGDKVMITRRSGAVVPDPETQKHTTLRIIQDDDVLARLTK